MCRAEIKYITQWIKRISCIRENIKKRSEQTFNNKWEKYVSPTSLFPTTRNPQVHPSSALGLFRKNGCNLVGARWSSILLWERIWNSPTDLLSHRKIQMGDKETCSNQQDPSPVVLHGRRVQTSDGSVSPRTGSVSPRTGSEVSRR